MTAYGDGRVCCRCGHLDVVHHLTETSRRRTYCTVSDGPRAIPCGCRRFTPEEVSR